MLYKAACILILLFLTACSSSGTNDQQPSESTEPVSFEAGAFVEQDLAFVHTESKETIQLGMTRTEVEAQLGEPTDSIDFMKIWIYPGIKVHYSSDKVNGIMIDDNTPERELFQSARGLRYGDSLDHIVETLGEPLEKNTSGGTTTMVYIIEQLEDEWRLLPAWDDAANKEKTYSISLNVDSEAGLYFYMIADYQFSTNPTAE